MSSYKEITDALRTGLGRDLRPDEFMEGFHFLRKQRVTKDIQRAFYTEHAVVAALGVTPGIEVIRLIEKNFDPIYVRLFRTSEGIDVSERIFKTTFKTLVDEQKMPRQLFREVRSLWGKTTKVWPNVTKSSVRVALERLYNVEERADEEATKRIKRLKRLIIRLQKELVREEALKEKFKKASAAADASGDEAAIEEYTMAVSDITESVDYMKADIEKARIALVEAVLTKVDTEKALEKKLAAEAAGG